LARGELNEGRATSQPPRTSAGPQDGRSRRFGLQEEVILLGERSDVPTLPADVEVFVLASAWEGMPYTIPEAMAAGKPALGSRVPGVTDLVHEGETGFCYRAGDPQELADRLAMLLRDGGLRRRLRGRGRRVVEGEDASQRMV